MIGSRLFNEQENKPIDTIYGCVTTGSEWQFLKLSGSIIYIDSKRYFMDNLSLLLGVLQTIIDQYIQKLL